MHVIRDARYFWFGDALCFASIIYLAVERLSQILLDRILTTTYTVIVVLSRRAGLVIERQLMWRQRITLQYHSDHLAFFRHTLGTRLGSKYTSHIGTTLRSRDQQIQQARIINLFKGGFGRKGSDLGENFGKFACLFRQTLHLVLLYIDFEVSQLWQKPSDQAGIFSVSYRIALFPNPAGTTT